MVKIGFERIRYNSGRNIVKIKIEDTSGALIENWTIMMSDLGKWVKQMDEKYGSQIKRKTDLDWAI